ncbi:meiotic recombination protein REC114 isoform X2 [Vidua macroura]|uniref:meiotic recombination protein REC114 isoform X2 n=1 Tax=Vidua chalybeata TaxID=81927 RepID=UPI0023A8234C|nr:meiotic recombination protein REC114 isoform X2 [Vidua chalybeata]XP_053843937.1 meiotic recombination protein REC114 isoform X2 [Vidua macroura]
MAAAGGGRGSQPGLASAPGSAGDTSLLGSATVWPLKRYGRFLPPKDGDHEGQNTSWKVFESNEESGPLVLTIVESGHFFISQGRTVLNECRMFRVQFGGSSREEMQEHCCSCVQKLSEYVPVQGAEEQSLSQDTQGMDTEHAPDEPLSDSCTSLGERRSVAQLAQSVLRQRPELPPACRHPAWSARELGPFIRLCLMDQHFPAFVEDVEKELHRLAQE